MIQDLIRQHLQGLQATHILDVGPGYADFSRIAAQVTGAREITFLDCDNDVLAWQLAETERLGLKAVALPVALEKEALSKVRGSYDVIHCQEVLEHLPNAPEVLSQVAALLRPGGRMIVTVPTKRSERWLKTINPSYMKDEPYGHVNEFDEQALRNVIQRAGLEIRTLLPTQPHYFLAHTWLFGTRMKIDGSTGRILTGGVRGFVLSALTSWSRKLFRATNPQWWGRVFPRNYFVVASKPTP
jgi:SAM-dependent methyltransferase